MDFENVGEDDNFLLDERILDSVLGQNDFVSAVANYFSFIDLKFFFRGKNSTTKFFWEYIFKLIVEGIAQQQNCLKIGRNLCHECGT